MQTMTTPCVDWTAESRATLWGRWERRAIQKENEKAAREHKRAETERIRGLVELARRLDPRLRARDLQARPARPRGPRGAGVGCGWGAAAAVLALGRGSRRPHRIAGP
jgi:hypothetical protein